MRNSSKMGECAVPRSGAILRNPSPPRSPPYFDHSQDQEMEKMETESEEKYKIGIPRVDETPEDSYCKWDPNLDAYHCEVCESIMNSEHTYRMHLQGKKHHKKLATVRLVSNPKVEVPLDANTNIQEIRLGGEHTVLRTKQLNQKSKIQHVIDMEKQPIIGLDYVTEILRLDKKQDPVYHCSLCPADCQLTSIIGHITGLKHRMTYMKLKVPEAYTSMTNCTEKRSSQSDRAQYFAERIEKDHGRGTMIVEEEIDHSEEIKEIECLESIVVSREEFKFVGESMNNLSHFDQKESLCVMLEDMFLNELDKPTLEEKQKKISANLFGVVKEKYIAGALAQMEEDTDKRIIEGDYSFVYEILNPVCSSKVGSPIREAVIKLKEKETK